MPLSLICPSLLPRYPIGCSTTNLLKSLKQTFLGHPVVRLQINFEVGSRFIESLSSNPPETPSSLVPIQIGLLESHLLCTKTWMQQWDGAWSLKALIKFSKISLISPSSSFPPACTWRVRLAANS